LTKTCLEQSSGRRRLTPLENMVRNQAVGSEFCMLEMICEGPKMMVMVMVVVVMMMMMMMMKKKKNHVRAISFGVQP